MLFLCIIDLNGNTGGSSDLTSFLHWNAAAVTTAAAAAAAAAQLPFTAMSQFQNSSSSNNQPSLSSTGSFQNIAISNPTNNSNKLR